MAGDIYGPNGYFRPGGGQGVMNKWRQVFGGQFGYSPEYLDQRYQEGAEGINRDYAGAQRGATADMAQRGFYGGRTMGHMVGQMGAARARSLSGYRRGLEMESEQLAQQQKGQLFQGLSQEEMGRQQHAYSLARMAVQQGYDIKKMKLEDQMILFRMAKQHGYNKDLAQFQNDLNKPTWKSWLGQVLGEAGGMLLGRGAGWLGDIIFGGGDDDNGGGNPPYNPPGGPI